MDRDMSYEDICLRLSDTQLHNKIFGVQSAVKLSSWFKRLIY